MALLLCLAGPVVHACFIISLVSLGLSRWLRHCCCWHLHTRLQEAAEAERDKCIAELAVCNVELSRDERVMNANAHALREAQNNELAMMQQQLSGAPCFDRSALP